jgi:hypothetical protein
MGSSAITYAVVALAIAAGCLIAGFLWGRSNLKAQLEDAVEKEHVALDAREFAMRTQLEDAIAEIAKLRPLAEELSRVQKRLEREQLKYTQMRAEFNSTMGLVPEPAGNSDPDPAQSQVEESADQAIQKLLQSLEVFNDPNVPSDEKPAMGGIPATDLPTPAVATSIAVTQPARVAEPPRPAEISKPAEAVRPVAPVRPAMPHQSKESIPAPLVSERAPAAAIPAQRPVVPPQKVISPEPRKAVNNVPKQVVTAANTSVPSDGQLAKAGQTLDEWQEFARQLEALTGKKK